MENIKWRFYLKMVDQIVPYECRIMGFVGYHTLALTILTEPAIRRISPVFSRIHQWQRPLRRHQLALSECLSLCPTLSLSLE